MLKENIHCKNTKQEKEMITNCLQPNLPNCLKHVLASTQIQCSQDIDIVKDHFVSKAT
jgi:hypothetical protein